MTNVRNHVLVLAALAAPACSTDAEPELGAAFAANPACDYAQVFGNASHTGIPCPEQFGLRVVAQIVQDPDADAENEFSGFMQIHASPPLTSGDFVVVPSKSGFVDGFDRSPERYHVQAWRWHPSVTAANPILKPAWTSRTDWQPVNGVMASFGYVTNGYVAQFSPAVTNGSVYVPARFGRVNRVSLATGALQAQIDPLAGTAFSGDERAILNSALSFDRDGNVYYSLIAWPLGTPNQALRGVQPRGTWIVQLRPDNTARLVDFQAIAAAAGLPIRCEYPFRTGGTPPATGPDSRAPIFNCGVQRPAINSAIAVDEVTGNLVIYSYANNAQGASFLTEVDPATMAPVRASDTRGHAMHGCGVRLPLDFVGGSGTSCQTITGGGATNIGFDPDFNGPVRFRGNDIMDNSPVVAPTGARIVGSYDGGFTFGGDYDARSFLVAFARDGSFQAVNSDYGWEVTPSIWRNGAEATVLQDRNLFSDFALGTARYDLSFNLEETHDIPLDLTPVAIDFTNAHVPFGPRGDAYHVNGDGHVYKFVPGVKRPVEALELKNSDGTTRSMSTLSNYWARDRAGRLYLSYAGSVYVIAGTGLDGTESDAVARAISQHPTAAHRLARSLQAKSQALADVTPPPLPQ